MASQPSKVPFFSAALGTVVVALCCFTPLLVSLLGVLGLAMFTAYLDIVLLPALVLLAVLTVLAYRRWRHAQETQSRERQG